MAGVAERRFGDADALRQTGENVRANGVFYLAGFTIEILLKAQLARRFPAVLTRSSDELGPHDRRRWALFWRQHDLEGLLDEATDLAAALAKRGEVDGVGYLEMLRAICATWTIYARYSTSQMTMADAAEFLQRVRLLKELLK